MRWTARLALIAGTAVLGVMSWVVIASGYTGLVGVPTDLDFFMRESFRGDEVDDRDFEYDDEYFLNVFSFRHLSSTDAIWAAHTRGYRLSMGSVTSDEFFLDHEAKFDAELGANLALHYRFVQAEDYDSRYFRNLIGLSYRISSLLAAYGFTRLNAFKEDIDMGGGLLVTTKPVRLNLGFVFPQAFLSMKSQEDERFERRAFGLGLEATGVFASRWTVSVRLFQNFPLEIAKPREALTFRFRRFVFGSSVTYRIDETSSLRLEVDGEDTEKEREFSAPRTLDTARLTRFALRASLVYSRAWASGTLLNAGIFLHRFDEPTRFPLAPVRTVERERTEAMLFGQLSMRVWQGLFVVPGFFAGYVEAIDRHPDAARPESGGKSIQAKVSLGLAYRFSDRAHLRLQPTFDLDQIRFGGAGAVAVVAF